MTDSLIDALTPKVRKEQGSTRLRKPRSSRARKQDQTQRTVRVSEGTARIIKGIAGLAERRKG